MLKPLRDIASILESAAVDYTGELKSELLDLQRRIRDGEAGYRNAVVVAALADLEAARTAYQLGDRDRGGMLLGRVSQAWWRAFLD